MPFRIKRKFLTAHWNVFYNRNQCIRTFHISYQLPMYAMFFLILLLIFHISTTYVLLRLHQKTVLTQTNFLYFFFNVFVFFYIFFSGEEAEVISFFWGLACLNRFRIFRYFWHQGNFQDIFCKNILSIVTLEPWFIPSLNKVLYILSFGY